MMPPIHIPCCTLWHMGVLGVGMCSLPSYTRMPFTSNSTILDDSLLAASPLLLSMQHVPIAAPHTPQTHTPACTIFARQPRTMQP